MRKLLIAVLLLLIPAISLAWTEESHWNAVGDAGWTCQSYTGGGLFSGTYYSIDCSSSTPDPPCSLKVSPPVGYPMNHEVAFCWNTFPAEADEIWFQYYVKFSPNWVWGRGSKFIFIDVGGDGNVFTSVSGGSKRVYITTQTFATNSYPPNKRNYPTMQAGIWYKHSGHFKINTPGVLDGLIEFWVNDVLTTRYTNVGFRSAAYPGRGFREMTVNFGIAGSDAIEGTYVLFDHSIASTEQIRGSATD
jgi:hypothetical protein